MTAAGPDPYAETVRLLPADTQQTREELIEVALRGILQSDIDAGFVEADNDTDQMHRDYATAAVDALLAHLAAQQARPMPGAHNR